MQKTATPRSSLAVIPTPKSVPDSPPQAHAVETEPAAETGPAIKTGTAVEPTVAPAVPQLSGIPDGPQIVLTERNCHVGKAFRQHAYEKLGKIGKFDGKVTRVDVEVNRESNPRLSEVAWRIELTVSCRGPVIRAEASAAEPSIALDLAWNKLQLRLRRSHQRRVTHTLRRGPAGGTNGRKSGRKTPSPDVIPLDGGLISLDGAAAMSASQLLGPASADDASGDASMTSDRWMQDGDGPFLLREKTHSATPMTLDQALYEMELIGHDFFLYVDSSSGCPCVLYRRRGYSYGLIRLQTEPQTA